jgi:signal peptide peptidase SppA
MTRDSIMTVIEGWLARLPIGQFRNPAPVVTVLRLHGVIGRIGPVGSGLTLARLEKSIDRAFSARHLKTVVLSINSPGGSPVQSALIAGRIRQLADEKDIPVVAFTEDVAASGGYWLACAADEIYAEDTSIVGSIGVISAGFGFDGAIARLGIERRLHATGPRKGMLDPFREERPEDVARLKGIQADIFESFKDHVRARRAGRLKADEAALFDGGVWSGREALALGLVDGLGDMRTVLRARFGDKVRLRPVGAGGGWLRRRFRLAGPSAGEIAAELVAAAEARALWARYGL